MDVERGLINAMLAARDLSPVHEQGIRPDLFYDQKNRAALAMLLRLSSEYSQVPTVEMLKAEILDWKYVEPEESISWLVDEVRRNHALEVLQDAMEEALTYLKDNDDTGTKGVLRSALNQLEEDLPSTKDIDIKGSGQERLERYLAINENQVQGILTGFRIIDDRLGGLKPGQLITFVGPSKAGKSTAMLSAGRSAHNQKKQPLFIGFEMGNEEQVQRLDAMASQISWKRLTRGQLLKKEERALRQWLHSTDDMAHWNFTNDVASTLTLSGVAAKIDRYRPDVVLVDGVYMMQDEHGEPPGSPQALTNITRGFKRMAQNFDIPVCISTQVLRWKMDKKRGITDNSIGYSSSFAQDSDAVIGVDFVEDDDTLRQLKLVLARNAGVGRSESYLRWNWDEGHYAELEGNPFAEEGEGFDASKF